MKRLIADTTLSLLIACALWAGSAIASAADQPSPRIYENQLTRLADPEP